MIRVNNMKRLNYAKRMHGPSGAIMEQLFHQTLAPSLAKGFGTSSEAEAVLASYSIRQAFGETAIITHDQRQLITSISISSPTVLSKFVTVGAMFDFDIVLLDLSRIGAPVVCSIESAGAGEAYNCNVCPLVLWVGPSGQAALVPSRPEIRSEDTWPASILFHHGRLQDAAAHPFADESDRIAGIERAIETVAKATAPARNGSPLSTLRGSPQ